MENVTLWHVNKTKSGVLSKNATHTPNFIAVVTCYKSGSALLHTFLITHEEQHQQNYHTPEQDTPILCKLPSLRLGDRDVKFAYGHQ